MAVVQDVPIIRFLSDDTIVDHGGSVRCSVFVQQQFGTMTIEIDTSNNGSYKALGNLGLSGSKKYLFSTGNACTWDSVKVRVTDNGMNVVTKGFRVRIRPRPLSITSIDSTVNTITIHYSKTKETDFSSYLIYRNTTSTVDTNSELWATITDSGITSYTLPAPSYALAPRYYRIYQRDNEGLWCVGSNVVYGNIVKSPPDKPVVIFPENNGDSIWPNDVLRWSCTPLTLNGLKISCKVFVNYNNTGYSQLATEPMDTSVRLTGCDTVQYLKFKITAFDSLGDSSSSSEKTAYIRHTVTDIDGNVYQTVTIGTQLWVVENLRTTKYNDGTAIPHVTDRAQWSSLSTPGYCWYDNSTVTTEHEKWGALYNWHAVNTGKLAPAGWHVPTDADWITIENYLIVDSFNNKNRTGFSVLPGYRDINGNFIQRGFEGYWWCVKEDGAPRTYIRYHNCLDADLSGPYGGGLSVRLLRD